MQVGSQVQVRQVIVTGSDGFAVFEVSDGSTFEVFPNSRVTFRANPANLKDILDVWLGRVKVHIQKLGGQPNNNRVITPTAVISVRGTVFDVAVEDHESTLVAVEEGLVEVQHALLPTKTPKLVNPGESLRVYRDQPLAQRSSPQKDAAIQQGLRAAMEAFYRIIYRAPSAGGVSPVPGGGGGGVGTPGGGAPGDVETEPPPPPPPPPPAQ
ncbi:MAG TPA: FecR domain-containing protein [Bryobacteraceae bacterium]|nr:FecR domain-containing protein [Bryobacteraceae bacterium]